MRHLLLSVDGVINKRNALPFDGIIKALTNFKNSDNTREVIVISALSTGLNKIPKELNPIKIPFNLRGSGDKLVDYLENELGASLDDLIVIGAKEKDMQTARHIKSILLRADYAKINNPTDPIYSKDYGIPLKDVCAITHFFDAFQSVENPWYCKVKVDDDTNFLALTSANTFSDSRSSVRIKDEFRNYLKNSKQNHVIPFACYFIVSAHLMMKYLAEFEFWDIYPSSGKDSSNADLEYFAKKAAHTFGKKFHSERLFLRNADAKVRHSMTAAERLEEGCDDQLKTMIINPCYKDKIEGKNICIIDDFSRHGTSSETTRLLLKKAGANKILFIAMGKFKADANYNRYTYELTGDVYSKVKFRQINREVITGRLNPKANKDFIDSLGKWI